MKNTLKELVHFFWVPSLTLVFLLFCGSIAFSQAQNQDQSTAPPGLAGPPQCPAPSFYSCNPDNMSQADLTACNRSIALTYAPDLRQFVSTCYNDSENGDADRITKVNYDGNWNASDNWESIEDFSSGGNFNFGTNGFPNAYYAVLWTENYWIITYSFYYSRDWAENGIGCGEDEHENDLARIMLLVKRPTSMLQSPASLLVGYESAHHNDSDMADCVPTSNLNVFCNSNTGEWHVHPQFWSTSGSHALHDGVNDGFNDPPWNPCAIKKENKLIHYAPSTAASAPQLCPSIPQCPLSCPGAFGQNGLDNILGTEHTESYGLIDVFHPTQGLWAQRNNPLVFVQGGPTENQQFVCTNGNGCGGAFIDDAAASAPWNGGTGMNPIPHIKNSDLFSLDCNCPNADPDCDPDLFGDGEYIFNPYMCDFKMVKENNGNGGANTITPAGVDISIESLFGNKSMQGLYGVNWNISTTPPNAIDCVGCSTDESNITLHASQNPCLSTGTILVHVVASFATADCGEKALVADYVFTKPGPMISGNQLTITQTGPPPCPVGNSTSYAVTPTNSNYTYSWSCMACAFTSDTHSSTVWAKKVSTYNPIFTVTVTNGCGTAVSPGTQLGNCPNISGGDLKDIKIFPNPASGIVHFSLEDGNLAESSELQIFVHNQFFEQKYSDQTNSTAWDIDVTNWEGGLYYLTVVLNGASYSKSFVVNNEGAVTPHKGPK